MEIRSQSIKKVKGLTLAVILYNSRAMISLGMCETKSQEKCTAKDLIDFHDSR